jgi:N-carbamoyl-L-amino-acid hydrolase
MPDRRDALCAAAELILHIEQLALAANADARGVDTVATVGSLLVHPGNINAVPSRVQLTLDIRDTDPARRDGIMHALHTEIAALERRRCVRIAEETINADQPTVSDPRIVAALEEACREEDATCRKLVSRAYHDTSFMARVCPVAMLFIPCRAGVSHRPDEYATPESIALGTRILAKTLAALSLA